MVSRNSRIWTGLWSAFMVLSLCVVAAVAQDDPDPNSPTPVLLTEPGSARVLARQSGSGTKVNLSKLTSGAFQPGSKVEIFVTNLSLLDGEGANAFRIYVGDNQSRIYRFPVAELTPLSNYPGVYRVVFVAQDEMKYWPEPAAGDLYMYLTWRGLASNPVSFGYGATDTSKQLLGLSPRPLSSVPKAAVVRNSGKIAGRVAAPEYIGYRWAGDRTRFLEQATFGPTPDLDSRVRRIGLKAWLAEQFLEPYPSASNTYPNIPMKPTTAPADCDNDQTVTPDVPVTCFRDTYTMYLPQVWFYKEALYGTPQLRHRIAHALSELWVISAVDTQQSSYMVNYHQVISRNAFGNWRQLMYEMTLNGGMGNYLDMMRSTKTNPNENYPREVLQLFNVGLFMLNIDGTTQLDGQGVPLPTYDQNVINNLTKVMTGWRDCRAADGDPNSTCPNAVVGAPDYIDAMSLATANHDLTAKTLLTYPGSTTTNIAACSNCTTAANIRTYAYNSLNQALDNIYYHPSLAPFVSKFLIQQLITGDPSPAYVARVANVFNQNRANPTQMKEVIKAILLDPEARGDVKTDPIYGKLREPIQLTTNVFRQVGVTSADGLSQSDGDINRFPSGMSQNLFTSPTVFNFYPPNYVIPGTTLLQPEFAIFNTGTAIARANFGNSVVYGQINVALPNTPNGTKLNLAELQALAAADTTSNQLLDILNLRLMHGTMSAAMRNSIITATNTVASSDPQGRARAALYLVVTSSQYQVQK